MEWLIHFSCKIWKQFANIDQESLKCSYSLVILRMCPRKMIFLGKGFYFLHRRCNCLCFNFLKDWWAAASFLLRRLHEVVPWLWDLSGVRERSFTSQIVVLVNYLSARNIIFGLSYFFLQIWNKGEKKYSLFR